jgi:hypothetical protein
MAIGETPSAEVASARDLSGYVSLQEARKNLLLSLFFCVSATRSETDCGKQARISAHGRQLFHKKSTGSCVCHPAENILSSD